MLKQTCLYIFEYNFFNCTELDDRNSSIEQDIQPYVANILMTISILNSIFPTFLSLFLGPWTDTYGRKKVINCIFVGYTISMAWTTAVSYTSDYISINNPWNYLFAQLPIIFSGGLPTLTIVILCYLTDQTDETNRSLRFTIVEIVLFGGVLTAVASSSFILKATNPTVVFSISLICSILATFIVIFFVDETVKVNKNISFLTQLKDLFSVARVKEIYITCVKKRSCNHRRILWSLTAILMLSHITINGSHTVFYLFVRQRFGWALQELTFYEAGTMLMNVLGCIIGLVLLKRYYLMSDLKLSTMALASLLVDGLIKAFAINSWHLYFASAIALLKMLAGPMLRSIMSTIVSKGEISMIYSITSAIEAISGLGASPLYTFVYSVTLISFPGAFNLITACIFALALVIIYFVGGWLMNSKQSSSETIQANL